MKRNEPLAYQSNITYVYDGTFEGLLCCVFACVYTRKIPVSIVPESEMQPNLFEQIYIKTDPLQAHRVKESIPKRISNDALEFVETTYLSCLKEKELRILHFLLLGYEKGPRVTNMLAHPDVDPIIKARKHMFGEVHLLLGFTRFSDYDGVLAATITPKNFVLPFIAPHFINRFSGEDFMIFDKTHKAALIYEKGKQKIVKLEHVAFPRVPPVEEAYRELWKQFYHTIAIQSRKNPRCRMTHMPKRYWENMTEMAELL